MPESLSKRTKSAVAKRAQNCCEYCFSQHRFSPDPFSIEHILPRLDSWRDHFRWNEDFSFIIGISPKGRATVEKLQLNREGVVNLRKVLFLNGEHPPLTQK